MYILENNVFKESIMLKKSDFNKLLSAFMLVVIVSVFLTFDLLKLKNVESSVMELPAASKILKLSSVELSPNLCGIKIDEDNPLNIDFIFDSPNNVEINQDQIDRLTNYFLAALTVPAHDLWVNLSPYEADRVIDNELSNTNLGKDLLRQDYVLKQLASSITHPDTEIGKSYWNEIIKKQSDHKLNSINKIWIVPEKADIYEDKTLAIITNSRLAVLTEEDYVARSNNNELSSAKSEINKLILPEISKDINYGKNFIQLRRIYHAIILASWFKGRMSESFYSAFINKEKINGLDSRKSINVKKIYDRYNKAYNLGVYDFIRQEQIKTDNDETATVKRRYFSGGFNSSAINKLTENNRHSNLDKVPKGRALIVRKRIDEVSSGITLETESTFLNNANLSDEQVIKLKDEESWMPASQVYLDFLKSSIKTDMMYVPELGKEINIIDELGKMNTRVAVDPNYKQNKIVIVDNKLSIFVSDVNDYDSISVQIIGAVIENLMKSDNVDSVSHDIILANIEKYIYRRSDLSYMTLFTGGTGGKLIASLKKYLLNVKSKNGSLPISFIVSPYDDGGGSRDLQDMIRNEFNLWTPPAGDQMNITSGLSDSIFKTILTYRLGEDDLNTDMKTILNNLIDSTKVVTQKDQELLDKMKLTLEPYIDYFDKNYINKETGIRLTKGQTFRNLLFTAFMIKEGVYAKDIQAIDETKYMITMRQITGAFSLSNVRIIPASFEPGVLYGIKERFEIATEDDKIGIALQNGLNKSKYKLRILKKGKYRLSLKDNPNDYLDISENFDSELEEPYTTVESYEDKKLVNTVRLNDNGKATKMTLNGKEIFLKGRLSIGQSNMTDGLNLSKFVKTGILSDKQPKASKIATDAIKNTQGMIMIGPGSLETSTMPIMLCDGIANALKKKKAQNVIPIIWNDNPLTDNENVGAKYSDIIERYRDVTGMEMSENIDVFLLNNFESSKKKLNLDKSMLDELNYDNPKIVKALERSTNDLSFLAKLRRGKFKGNSFKFRDTLEQNGINVVFKDVLDQIGREVRTAGASGKADLSFGFKAEVLAQIYEKMMLEHLQNTHEWKALQGQMHETSILARLNKIKSIWPNMSLSETLSFLYDYTFASKTNNFFLPLLDIDKHMSQKPSVFIMNFANTVGISENIQKVDLKINSSTFTAMNNYLSSNPDTLFVIKSGLSAEELKTALIDSNSGSISKDNRNRIILMPSSGAEYAEINKDGDITNKSQIFPISNDDIEETRKLVERTLSELKLDKPLLDYNGLRVAEALSVTYKGLLFAVETGPWVINTSSQFHTKIGDFKNVKKALVAHLDQAIKLANVKRVTLGKTALPFRAQETGNSVLLTVNIPAKNRTLEQESIEQLLEKKITFKRQLDTQMPAEEVLFIGRGFQDFKQKSEQFRSSLSISLEIQKGMFGEGNKVYHNLGPNGFADLLRTINQKFSSSSVGTDKVQQGGVDFADLNSVIKSNSEKVIFKGPKLSLQSSNGIKLINVSKSTLISLQTYASAVKGHN